MVGGVDFGPAKEFHPYKPRVSRPPLEKLAELAARADAMAPEQRKKFRDENDARIKELLFRIALRDETWRMCGEKVHKAK